ncbi:SPOR domain-containing protein [Amedibacillus dolichus]|uniref:SPOR domain-containing protein n=1 Tax=Amedibacillus dolichus TaxID=31971 RepID=UPI0026721323|nr:SPOR domain-containing protein [Amedibacillus dolichus]
MQNKKIIILYAVFFSVIFSLIYYFLFTVAFVSPQDKKIVLYMNQVGLYEQASGVESMMKRLQEAGLEAYAFEKDGLQAVVSGVSRKEKETQANGDKLSQLQQNYIMKKVTIEDPELVALIEEHKIDEVLERLNE